MTADIVENSRSPAVIDRRYSGDSCFARALCAKPSGGELNHQLAAKYGYSLATKPDPIAIERDLHDSAPRGNLMSDELRLVEAALPKGSEAAVRRACDRIFVNAGCRR